MADMNNTAAESSAEPSVEDVLNYDFFGESSGELDVTAADPGTDVGAETDEVSVEKQETELDVEEVSASEQSEGSSEVIPQKPPTVSPEVQALVQQNQMLQQQLMQMAAVMQQRQTASTEAPPSKPAFAPQIPAEVSELLDSEDPRDRMKALQLAVTAASQQVLDHVQTQQGQLAQAIPATIQQQMQAAAAQQAINQDFYGNHKDLANPMLAPIIQQVGREVAMLHGAQGWSPELRDAIAATVRQRLGLPQPAKPQQRGPKAPAIVGKSGTRATPKPSSQSDQSEQIADILHIM